ncbi:MAG: hypothetical protein IPM02_16450 [Betaproteobacteria bacterium]|nr:hypothetical protein [Betaproteobacteria bacterium]
MEEARLCAGPRHRHRAGLRDAWRGRLRGRWEYACIGSVANLASRLCNEAKGGQILINQKTLSRVEDVVEAEPLGEATLKGIAQPVPVFNITALKS